MIDKDKRNDAIIAKINSGYTWEDLEREFDLTRGYMQTCLKKYLANDERKYKILLSIAKANSKGKVIYISETGALLSHPAILRNKTRVFVPNFCKREITNIQIKNNEDYAEIINNSRICWADIFWEDVKTIPNRNMKHRTVGITAFCCAMAKRNKGTAVKLYTNSRDIAELVNVQNIPNLTVIKL